MLVYLLVTCVALHLSPVDQPLTLVNLDCALPFLANYTVHFGFIIFLAAANSPRARMKLNFLHLVSNMVAED